MAIDSETLAAEVHEVCVTIRSMEAELREVTNFISELKQVVEAMSENPMLKTLGFGGMPKPDGNSLSLPGMQR